MDGPRKPYSPRSGTAPLTKLSFEILVLVLAGNVSSRYRYLLAKPTENFGGLMNMSVAVLLSRNVQDSEICKPN